MTTLVHPAGLACPYPGLRPFQREEADIFFGREEQVDQILDKLSRAHFLALVGTSGCGKSSLARAGMIPALETGLIASAGIRWRVATMKPGDRPLSNLADALLALGVLGEGRDAVGAEKDEQNEITPFVRATLRRGPLGLVEILSEPLTPGAGPRCRRTRTSCCWSTSSRRSSASAARATATRPMPLSPCCWPPPSKSACPST